MTGSFRPILLKKSVFERAAFRQLKNCSIPALANQISTSLTLFHGQKSRWDFFNRIGQKLTFGPFHFVQEAMLITLEFASISTRCLPCCRPAWTKN